MGRRLELLSIGERIGVVTVIGRVFNEVRGEWEYVCRCRCGAEFKSRKDHLKKPRQGCRACIQKVRADIDLANTISEEEYMARLELKNFAEKQKKALTDRYVKYIYNMRDSAKYAHSDIEKGTSLQDEIWLGRKFGLLTIINITVDSAKTYWVCECACGRKVKFLAKDMRFGRHISCGCHRDKSKFCSISEKLFDNVT